MLKTYKVFYRFVWNYKWRALVFAISIIFLTILESVYPYFYKLFVDMILDGQLSLLVRVLLFYVALRVFVLGLEILTHFLSDRVIIDVGRDIRLAVFRKIQKLDFAYHLNRSSGSLISAIKRGDSAVFNFFHTVNIQMTRVIISFLVMMVFFGSIDLKLAVLMCASVVFALILALFLIRRNVEARVEYNKREDDISGLIVDNMINFETVKFFAKEDSEYFRLQKSFREWTKFLWQYAHSFRFIDITMGLISNLSLLLVLYLGLKYLLANQITAGDYVMILGFVNNFYNKFIELVFQMRNVAKNHTDLESYFKVFDHKVQVRDPDLPQLISKVEGRIDFVDISFSYPQGKVDALVDFDLSIKKGESVALVGYSGAGKTTVVKLLLRFFDPDCGKVQIDGVDIKNLQKTYLRSLIGVVPQEPVLFNQSIAYNIGYSIFDQEVDLSLIKDVAKMANLDEFIEDLPEGYHTKVGERGVKLSGGQKQRLAIARMLLANPQIIIFDEATSQLDSHSEKLIQDALWKVSKNRTTLIIAHRLSSVVRADRIIVMDQGSIAQVGSHLELLNQEGLYKKFWDLQTKSAKSDIAF